MLLIFRWLSQKTYFQRELPPQQARNTSEFRLSYSEAGSCGYRPRSAAVGAGRAARAPGPASRGTAHDSARIPPDIPAPRDPAGTPGPPWFAATAPTSILRRPQPSAPGRGGSNKAGAARRNPALPRRCPRSPRHCRSPRGAPLPRGCSVPPWARHKGAGQRWVEDPAHLLKSRIRRRRAGVDMAEPRRRLPPALAARPHKQPAMAAPCAGRGRRRAHHCASGGGGGPHHPAARGRWGGARRLSAAPRSAEFGKRQRENVQERAWECGTLGPGESPALPHPGMPHPGPSRAGKGPGESPALPRPGPAAPGPGRASSSAASRSRSVSACSGVRWDFLLARHTSFF